jgi:hypothetical protein
MALPDPLCRRHTGKQTLERFDQGHKKDPKTKKNGGYFPPSRSFQHGYPQMLIWSQQIGPKNRFFLK